MDTRTRWVVRSCALAWLGYSMACDGRANEKEREYAPVMPGDASVRVDAGTMVSTPAPDAGEVANDAAPPAMMPPAMPDPSDPGDPNSAPGCAQAAPSCDNKHTFTRQAVGAKLVQLAGDFTDWAKQALAMMDDGKGNWSITVELSPGVTHKYKYIVDGQWDPGSDQEITVCGGAQAQASCALAICESPKGTFRWEDSVMYFALTDRMQNSDHSSRSSIGSDVGPASSHFEGGDFTGVAQKLDYLTDLGVTAVWLSAPFRQQQGANTDPASGKQYTAFHGYWPSPLDIDFDAQGKPTGGMPQVDARWGSADDLRALVQKAHAAQSANGFGVRVLFDYVMKHVAGDSPLYAARKSDLFIQNAEDCRGADLKSASDDLWDHPTKKYTCKFPGDLNPFDFSKPAARHWSVSDALWWAKEYDLDGYRLDAIKHVLPDWLSELRGTLKSELPMAAGGRFYLVGETFAYDRNALKEYVEPASKLDGQFDFPLRFKLCETTLQSGKLSSLRSFMDENDRAYGPAALMSTFIGNHDLPRAVHFAERKFGCDQGGSSDNGWNPGDYPQPADSAPYERLALAFAVIFTNQGIPVIYYGDEVGLAGGGDPDNRRFFPEEASLHDAQRELRRKVRALARARAQYPVLGRGLRETIGTPTDTTWVFRKFAGCRGELDDVVVALNSGDQQATVSIPQGDYDDLIEGGMRKGGELMLAPRSFVVLHGR